MGRLFRRLRDPVAGMVSAEPIGNAQGENVTSPSRRMLAVCRKRFGDLVVATGLWELFFFVRLSSSMARFIEEFKPDLIYCQGYSLTFTKLPLLIARSYKIPVVFQTTDDWPSYTYRYSPIGWILRHETKQLLRSAAVRFAFGDRMRQLYEERYKVPFRATYHLDRPERFSRAAVHRDSTSKVITFTGSLGLRRYEGISDLLQAVRTMGAQAGRFEIRVYCPGIPREVPAPVRDAPEVKFLPLPRHGDVPAILREADVLFLPESFTVDRRFLELLVIDQVPSLHDEQPAGPRLWSSP